MQMGTEKLKSFSDIAIVRDPSQRCSIGTSLARSEADGVALKDAANIKWGSGGDKIFEDMFRSIGGICSS